MHCQTRSARFCRSAIDTAKNQDSGTRGAIVESPFRQQPRWMADERALAAMPSRSLDEPSLCSSAASLGTVEDLFPDARPLLPPGKGPLADATRLRGKVGLSMGHVEIFLKKLPCHDCNQFHPEGGRAVVRLLRCRRDGLKLRSRTFTGRASGDTFVARGEHELRGHSIVGVRLPAGSRRRDGLYRK